MKVAISKLPKNPWWGTGIIGYKDNPAMRDGIIPDQNLLVKDCLLYTSPSPRDKRQSRMPSSA